MKHSYSNCKFYNHTLVDLKIKVMSPSSSKFYIDSVRTHLLQKMLDFSITDQVSRGAVRSAESSICSNAYGGWFAPRPRHSVRMTYRPSAALWLLGSLKISHNKFLRANKWILS